MTLGVRRFRAARADGKHEDLKNRRSEEDGVARRRLRRLTSQDHTRQAERETKGRVIHSRKD
jgi:hypothetical protein